MWEGYVDTETSGARKIFPTPGLLRIVLWSSLCLRGALFGHLDYLASFVVAARRAGAISLDHFAAMFARSEGGL